jgi:hypothetical protein
VDNLRARYGVFTPSDAASALLWHNGNDGNPMNTTLKVSLKPLFTTPPFHLLLYGIAHPARLFENLGLGAPKS